MKEFDIFFSPHLAVNDDVTLATTQAGAKRKLPVQPFPTLKRNTLKYLSLLTLPIIMINACAGVSTPTGGGSTDGGSGAPNGAAGIQAPFGGNFSGPTTANPGATAGDATDSGDLTGLGSGSDSGGNTGGGNNNPVGGQTAPGADSPASLPQSSIPPPMVKKKVNIYATDTQGNTPVIGSAEAIEESQRDGNHVVVISTEPLENVMARLEIKKQFEVAQNGMDSGRSLPSTTSGGRNDAVVASNGISGMDRAAYPFRVSSDTPTMLLRPRGMDPPHLGHP